MTETIKVVRTDRELECPHVDKVMRDQSYNLVLLPDAIDQARLARAASVAVWRAWQVPGAGL